MVLKMDFSKLLKKLNSPILILGLLLLIIFYPVLFGNKALFLIDVASLDQGLTTYVVNLVKKGEFPLFLTNLLSGNPLLGVYPPLYYPPMLLFLILPFHLAFCLLVILHLFLAGLGVYLTGIHWKLSKAGSLYGALIYSLNGYMMESQNMYQWLFAFCWIPFIFLYTEKTIDNKNFKNFLFLTLFSALQLATGRMDFFYFTQMFLWIWIIWRLVNIYKFNDQSETSKGNIQDLFKITGLLVLSIILAILLLSVEILPLLDYLKITDRSGGALIEDALGSSLNPFQLLQLIFNNLFGDIFYNRYISTLIFGINPTLFYNLYIGLPAFLIIIVGINGYKKYPKAIPIFLISIFFFFLSFGKFSYLYEILYKFLPGFNIARYPLKLYSISIFCLSLLAIFGFERIVSEKSDNKLLKFLIYGASFILLFLIYLIIFYNKILAYLNFLITADNLILENLNFLFISLEQTLGYILLFIILLLLLKYERINVEFFKISILALICIELGLTNISNVKTIDKDKLYKKPEIAQDIEDKIQDKKLYRIISVDKGNFPKIYNSVTLNSMEYMLNALLWNRYLLYDFKSIQGGISPEPQHYNLILEFISDFSSLKMSIESKAKILKMMGVRFYIWNKLNKDIAPPDKRFYKFIKSYEPNQLELWELKDYQPIFTFKSKAFVNNSEKNIFDFIIGSSQFSSDYFNLKDTVILYENEGYKKAISLVKKDKSMIIKEPKVNLLEETANKITLQVEAPASGYVVLANNHFKDWKAYDNGIETPILKANFYQQAIRVSSGKHQIKLIYYPFSFTLGLIITLITLFILLCSILAYFYFNKIILRK